MTTAPDELTSRLKLNSGPRDGWRQGWLKLRSATDKKAWTRGFFDSYGYKVNIYDKAPAWRDVVAKPCNSFDLRDVEALQPSSADEAAPEWGVDLTAGRRRMTIDFGCELAWLQPPPASCCLNALSHLARVQTRASETHGCASGRMRFPKLRSPWLWRACVTRR